MRHMPTLSEAMTAFPLHISEDTSLAKAAELMKEHNCGHLPVLNADGVLGVLSRIDVALARQPGHSAAELTDLVAGDMCRPAPVFDLHTRLDVVLDGMADNHGHAVLVMKGERLAGIVTAKDVCSSYAAWLQKEFLPPDDPEIA